MVSERERILRATAELWSEVGYEGLCAEAICARAEIKAEDFAAEFSNVERTAEATLELIIAEVIGLMGREFAPDRSEPESCALGIAAILEFMAANPALAYVIYVGRRQRVPPRLRETSRRTQRVVVAVLDRLRDSSSSNEQPGSAGVGALGSPEAIIRREILAGRTALLSSLAPDLAYGALVPFVGQAEALRLARLCRDRSPGIA